MTTFMRLSITVFNQKSARLIASASLVLLCIITTSVVYAQSSQGYQRRLAKEKEFLICTEGKQVTWLSKEAQVLSHNSELHETKMTQPVQIILSQPGQENNIKLFSPEKVMRLEIEGIEITNILTEKIQVAEAEDQGDRKVLIIERRENPESSEDTEQNIVVTWITDDENEVSILIEDDLVLDQTRDDGTSMYMDGNYTRATNTISCEVVLNQAGYTVVDAIDPETGKVLRTLYEGTNAAERKIFEFDYSQSEAKQIMIEAQHTSNSGQSLKSQLLFDIDRTEEVPTSITPSADLGFEAQLSPTLGKGEFKIQADFKSAATVRVLIMDLNGKLVETLHSGPVLEGTNIFTGNSSAWASGTYIASIQNGKSVWTQKMIVH